MTSPLNNAGAALYGRHWIAPLARDLGITRNYLSLIANGRRPEPYWLAADVAKLLAERRTALDAAVAYLEPR